MPNGKIRLGDAIRHQLNKLSWATSSDAWTPHHSLRHRENLLLSRLQIFDRGINMTCYLKLNFLRQKYCARRCGSFKKNQLTKSTLDVLLVTNIQRQQKSVKRFSWWIVFFFRSKKSEYLLVMSIEVIVASKLVDFTYLRDVNNPLK